MLSFLRVSFVLLIGITCVIDSVRAAGWPAPFEWRARVVTVQEKTPEQTAFSFSLEGKSAAATGSAWSEWTACDAAIMTAARAKYPNNYIKRAPLVLRFSLSPVVDPTAMEVQIRFGSDAEPVTRSAELYGSSLGILIAQDTKGNPTADTMATYNQRYWKQFSDVLIPVEERPKHFPIIERLINSDNDRRAWAEGIGALAAIGFSGIMVDPYPQVRTILLAQQIHRTAWAVYSPPGYAFDLNGAVTADALDAWAHKSADAYKKAGYAPEDMSIFAMSDEPGWYFPSVYKGIAESKVGCERLQAYLRDQGLEPGDVGATSWAGVKPLGRSGATTLPGKRLFYWSTRFVAWDSARHFANATKALEKAFYPNMPIVTNWNFFSGRLYVPGPVANNPDKKSPDAAMGGHDWTEFARMRGGTMLWTEDWFGDELAYQWSYYCSRLRTAAAIGGLTFGGYVIPRTAGGRENGILQKILTIIGSGGKGIKYFVFGPEYNFPTNCYSEKCWVMRKAAVAHRMIGKAEAQLWPGKRPQPVVAILHPRSAQLWDDLGDPHPNHISDATNNQLNRKTVTYMAEVSDLYLALQHANIPCDIISEDELTADGLKPYRALYVTAPDLPVEGQKALVAWTQSGGTLVTVRGVAAYDRYHEPSDILTKAMDVQDPAYVRKYIGNAINLPPNGPWGDMAEAVSKEKAATDVETPWSDAVMKMVTVGKGKRVHFRGFPGLTYWRSARHGGNRLPEGYSAAVRALIIDPLKGIDGLRPVETDMPLIETPFLISDAGIAVTLLNWTNKPIEKLTVTIRTPYAKAKAESVTHGALALEKGAARGEFVVTIPLDAADIITVVKEK